jgi:hypothetical protein
MQQDIEKLNAQLKEFGSDNISKIDSTLHTISDQISKMIISRFNELSKSSIVDKNNVSIKSELFEKFDKLDEDIKVQFFVTLMSYITVDTTTSYLFGATNMAALPTDKMIECVESSSKFVFAETMRMVQRSRERQKTETE